MAKKATAKKSTILDGELRMRVVNKELAAFMKKSESVTGKPYQVFLREIISAFNNDHLRIIKPDGQKTNTVYVTR